MPYYKKPNILFIHIPKTGGTVIENAIKKQYTQTLYNLSHLNKILDPPFHNVSLQHQFYTTLSKFRKKLGVDFNNIKIFSIVRNPYDRIISDLFWNKLIEKNYSADRVYNVIKNNYLYRNDLDNHNIPQYKFITDENLNIFSNIKVFRTETLNESQLEINEYLDIDINIQQNNVNKDYSRYLNKNSITLINEFYKKDFEIFNYKMI